VRNVSVLVGNPRPGSRTFAVGLAVAESLVTSKNRFEVDTAFDLATVDEQFEALSTVITPWTTVARPLIERAALVEERNDGCRP
jgi:hypothetical protein